MRSFKVPLTDRWIDLDEVVSIDMPRMDYAGMQPRASLSWATRHQGAQRILIDALPCEIAGDGDGYDDAIEDRSGRELVLTRVTDQVFEPLLAAWSWSTPWACSYCQLTNQHAGTCDGCGAPRALSAEPTAMAAANVI